MFIPELIVKKGEKEVAGGPECYVDLLHFSGSCGGRRARWQLTFVTCRCHVLEQTLFGLLKCQRPLFFCVFFFFP